VRFFLSRSVLTADVSELTAVTPWNRDTELHHTLFETASKRREAWEFANAEGLFGSEREEERDEKGVDQQRAKGWVHVYGSKHELVHVYKTK